MTFRFANPAAFQWLWLIPVLFALAIYIRRRQAMLLIATLGEKLTPFLTASVSNFKRHLKLTLELVCLAAMVFALARPQSGESKSKVKSEGVELMLLVDVSNSMLTEDARPSRLDLAKVELTRFVETLGGDKVGIIAFAGSAILLSPLTNDKSAIKMFLDSLSPTSVATQGTEFKKALLEAEAAFDRGGLGDNDGSHVTRAIVIASDGEDNEVGAMDVASQLVKKDIRIFSLAFGTEKGGPIPVKDDRGNLLGHRKDKSGKVVMSQTKGTVLKQLAQEGKGSFYHVSFGGDAVKNLAEDLLKLEKSEFESADLTNYDENYQPILFLAFLLGLIELLLGERRKNSQLWRGRFEVER